MQFIKDNMTDFLEIKKQLHKHCQQYVDDLIQRAQKGIYDAQQEANREQKSSAGDKFETHRAMMHLQMESFVRRLQVAQELDQLLNQVPLNTQQKVSLGSLVITDYGLFFIALSAPICLIENQEYTCLSPQAPFYQAMRGLQTGDWIEWALPNNDEDEIEILEIY